MNGYFYLASPYSDPEPLVREQRYLLAAQALRTLLRNGLYSYSPIVHCHELAKIWDMPRESNFWDGYNYQMLKSSAGLFVLRLPRWNHSVGVKKEIVWAIELKLSISYLSPEGGLDVTVEAGANRNPGGAPAS